MKNSLLNKGIYIILFSLVFTSCYDETKGTFYLSNQAHRYAFDTSAISFQMIDNHGITEEFYQDDYQWYNAHHYFEDNNFEGKSFYETFDIAFYSVLNNFYFSYVLQAKCDGTEFEFDWNRTDNFYYNLNTNQFLNNEGPKISFFDTLNVQNVCYKRILLIDYSKKIHQITKNTPVKIYFSGEKGLIKFMLKDSTTFERIN